MNLFSVVIPTFNRSAKLKRAVESVLTQTYKHFEILVIDDGSTDNSQEIIQNFCDERISYIWQPNSGGPALPRNTAINLAKGGWISFLDSDDIWYKHKLEILNEAIVLNKDKIFFCHNEDLENITTGLIKKNKCGPSTDDFYRDLLLKGNVISTSASTVTQDFLDSMDLRFDENPFYQIVEDYDLWLRIASKGGGFHFINDVLGKCFVEEDSISNNLDKYYHNLIYMLQKHVTEIQSFDNNHNLLLRKLETYAVIGNSKSLFLSGKFLDALKKIVKISLLNPVISCDYILRKLQKILKFK
jgi:glycosyltransferase involved in cell wall biosynthesis